jgi:D-inositol-3-phosphate glycosyltransferase
VRPPWRRQAAPEPVAPEPPPVANGALDAPAPGAVLERGLLSVAGWLLFPDSPTSRVEVFLGERSLGLAQLGIARADVAAETGLATAAIAGFTLARDLGEWPAPAEETELRAEATAVGGEKLALGPVPVTLAATVPPPAPPPLASTSSPRPARGRGPRVLVCTHQLCLGGASRYLVETLAALIELEAIDPVVLSPIGGPSRPMLEALGIPVHVSGPAPLEDLPAYEGRIEELLAWAEPQGFEAAFVNTVSPLTGAGAEVAARLGIPALWAIHESFELSELWAGCSADVRARLEAVLRRGQLGIFEAEATARMYEGYLPGRCRTIPYGLDLAPIDELRQGFDRVAARERLGVPAEAELVLCVGSVDPRKAQAVLAQAFGLVAERHPRARLALAGAGDTVDTAALAEWIAASGLADRIELIPTTPEIQQWYGVADLLVCPSRVESLPRVALEAMAWELPILATSIFGLPELIEDGESGWLCEPGDTAALAAALDAALSTGVEERRRVGRNGRARLLQRHEMDPYATTLADLFARAARGEDVSRAGSGGAGPVS